MKQKERKKTSIHRRMTICEMILCVVLIPNLILSCIMIAKSFASDGFSGLGAPIGVVTDSINIVTENHADYSDATTLDSFEIALNAEKNTVILTKYIGSDSAVSVAPQYVINDEVYNTVLDSTTVFALNTKITSVKLYPGVGFANNTMDHLFYQCGNLVSVDMEGVNTTGVTDMSYVFETCSKLTTIDMTGIDTSRVTTMYALFSKCENLSSLIGYENWDTSSLENIFWMFNKVQGMELIDISKWDLSKINNSAWCFQHCHATQILLPDNLKTISAGFLNHAINITGTSFTIPVGVEKIGYAHTIYDFATNNFVEFIVPAENKNYVAIDGILYSADGKEMLAIPRNKAFENNTYFIPEGVEFLGELSFSRNYNIHTLVLPNSYEITHVPEFDERYIVFEDIGNLNGGNTLNLAIYLYTGITSYEVKDDNPRYESVNGIIYSEDMTKLLAIPTNYKQYIDIPEGVTTWTYDALWFYGSTRDNISGVNIPSTMIDISPDQLDNLNNLIKSDDKFKITVHPDNPVYSLDENGKIVVVGEVTTMNETTRESYSTFAEAISNANDGDIITLLTDLSVSESINITSDLTLKSGKTDNKYPEPTTFALRAGEYVQEDNVIKRADGYTGTLFTVSEGATLTLDDGLIIDGGNNWTLKIDELKDVVNNYVDQKYNTALAFVTPESDAPIATDHMFVVNGSLVINNATIKNNIGLEGKSLIYVGMGGKLVMNDGAVITKIAGYSIGSVAFFNKGSTFDMNGGEISWSVGHENSALLNNDGAIMTMNGGVIKNNHATNSMGMIMRVDSSDASYPAKLIINDGLICNNVALPGSNGPNGSVFDIVKNGYFEMHGGTMCHNVGRRAVTINHRGVHAEITGGTIVDNVFLYTSGAPSGAFDTSTKITGGTFGTDIREGFMGSVTVENAIPSGYEVFENSPSHGLWSVEQGYMVTFTDRDGNVLQSAPVRIGDTPVFYSDYSPIDNPEAYVWVWDQEMVPITDSDATYTGRWELAVAAVVKKDNPDDPVKYYDFLTAIDAAGDGDTVLLLADIAMTSAVNITGKSITIDADNHTITRGKDSNGAWYTGKFFNIPSGASLTLDGGLTIDGANNWTYNKTDGVYDLKNAVDNYVDFTGYNKHHFITYEPNGAVAIETMIYVTGSLTINDVTIQNNAGSNLISVGNGGLLTTNEKAVFTHNACESSGTVVYMGTGSTFIMNGGTMTQNVGGDHGGCVRIDGGQMIMNGGLVQHNHTAHHASFVRLDYNASFTMNGGKICENVCFPSPDNKNKAGSVIDAARSSAVITINGGTICHNYGHFTGGINHIGAGLTITGGTLVNNTAWGTNNGIKYNDLGYKKPATITGGTYSTHPLTACTATDKSGIMPVTHKIVENDNGTYTVREKFQLTVTFEGIDGSVTVMEDDLLSAPAENPIKLNHIFEGWDYDFSQPITQDTNIKAIWTEAVASIENGGTTTYYRTLQEAIDAAEALAALGDGTEIQTVNLLKNTTVNKSLTVDSGNIFINGNCFTIIRDSAYTGTLLTVKAGATLTLDGDLIVDGGNDWQFNYDKYYDDLIDWENPVLAEEYDEWFTVDSNDPKATAFMIVNKGTLNLNNVTIQNNYATGSTGVVTTDANSVTNFNGAHIHHIAAEDGQGVVIYIKGSNSVANINQGTLIETNHGGQNFALLYATLGGTLNINGGEISNNPCWDSGGIIGGYSNGTINITGGKICGNSCANTPSGKNSNSVFYMHNNSTLNISGGEICCNITNAGVIYKKNGSTVNITNGEFVDNVGLMGKGSDIYDTVVNTVITGGAFMQDVNKWCDLGYAAFNDGPEAGKWTVEPGYWVTFTDEEGNVLQTAPLRIGATPTFNSELPEIDNPGDYIWVWDKEFVPVADAPVTYEGSWKLAVAAVIKKDNPDDPNPERYYDLQMAIDAAEDGDTVVLLADIAMTSKITLEGKSITLDGDGYTITRGKDNPDTTDVNEAYTGTLFSVSAGATLTLDGGLIIDSGNEWTFDYVKYTADLYNYTQQTPQANNNAYFTLPEGSISATDYMFVNSGTLNLNDVTIKNHFSSKANATLVNATSNSVTTLNDAKIFHIASTNSNSSGVIVKASGTGTRVDINNNTLIEGNHSSCGDGLISITNGAILTINEGVIQNNTAWHSNGHVIGLGGSSKFYMNGGTICHNSAVRASGGNNTPAINIQSSSEMIMSGGSICHNIGVVSGGIMIYPDAKNVSITGGEVLYNTSFDKTSYGASYHDVIIFVGPTRSITGGVFTQDVNKWCPLGYVAFADTPEDGQWRVEPGYWITFQDENGNVLQKEPVRVGDTPIFSGELPAIENEDAYLWVWDKEIVPVADSDVTYTGSWKLAVAAVIKKDNPNDPNPTRYYDFYMAMDAAEDGDTVVLLTDIEMNKKYTVAGKSITLDGDSHTITRGKNANGTWYTGQLFAVQSDASLTLDGNLTIDGGNKWKLKETEYNAAIEAEMAVSTTEELVQYTGFDMLTKDPNDPVATDRMFSVSGTVIVNETTIKNHCGNSDKGVFVINANGSVILNKGALITHNACGDTSVVAYMNDESNFTINDGAEISDNYFARNGGVICNRGGILTMNGGKIINNRGVRSNGSVMMLYTGDATFIMKDGLICGNISLNGSGAGWCNAIYLHNNSIVKIYGGSICHNSGGYNGGIGGFKNETSSKLYIEGGYIGENIARFGDIVGYKDHYDVLLSANPFHKGFSGGTFTQDVNEFCIPGYIAFANTPEAGKWTVEPGYWVTFADEEGNVLQKVPVRVGDTPVFSGELPEIENEDDYLWIWDKPIVPVTDSDVTYTGGWKLAVAEVIKKDNPDNPNPMRFHELQLAIDAAENGDTVRLLADIPLTSKVTVAGKSITLDGDGHTITRGKDANNAWYAGNLFTINADSALVLDGNLTVDGANNWTFNEVNGQKEYLYIAENYTNTPYDGALQFITSEKDGANATAQMFLVDGSLTINSTTIKNHYSTKYSNAGAVSVIKVNGTGTLVVNDKAVLTHNATADRGTIVHMAQNSWFYMNGGELSWSVGYWHGGCINNVGGYMVMNGGSINNNHSTYGMGSVLFIYDTRAHASIPYPNFVMNGGEICYNVNIAGNGGGHGGAIYARNGLMEMHGGIIHHNYGRNQGGISVGSGIRITITEGAIVENIDLLGKYVTHDLDGTSTTNKISGGTFTQDVNAWCVTEYIAVPQEKGYVATVPNGVPPEDTSYEISEDFTAWVVDKTSIESISQEKEIFGTVTDSANTTINNDSAYTVEINVNHFYNKCYLSPEIHFSQNLPVNTTIILRDIDKDAPGYWAYTVKTETNSIPLSEFVRMGSTETFSTPMVKPAFRFVIDFSKTENGMPSDSLETSLKLIPATTLPTDNANYYKSGAVYWVPESEAENFEGTVALSPVENIILADKKFTLETDSNGGFSSTIDYEVEINAEASKWDYREFALLINIPEAPKDAILSALVNGSERTIIPYTPGNYIIPLGSVFKGQVIITLESNMFPINGKEYTATCSLYASESVADSSPLNGERLVQKTEGLFTKTDDYASIKITGPLIDAVEKHVFDSWDDVTVTVEKIIPDNYTIKVQLEQKDSDGNYVKMENKAAEQDGNTYTFDLDDCEPDSYRIVVFALRTSDGFVSAQAPYYFIVE